MYPLLITLLLLFIVINLYFKIADHYNIIDKPNARSSHSYITIRGGGVIFPLAVLMWFAYTGFKEPWLVGGLLAMAVISFLDDILTLSSKIRILVHLLAVSLLFIQTDVYSLHWWGVFVAYVLTIGWINTFNFMDGINGITVLYALVTIGTYIYLDRILLLGIPEELLWISILALVVFGFYNLRRRARAFAGDVGSVSIAFLLAYGIIVLIMKTQQPGWLLLFSVYGIDSIITIIYRLKRKENIFQAHRSHLYQYLSNELHWPHVTVSVIYAITQLIINLITIYLYNQGQLSPAITLIFLTTLGLIYLLLRQLTLSIVAKQQ